MKVKPMTEGSGLLDGLKKVGKVLKPAAVALAPVAKEVAKEGLDLLGQAAKDKAREKMAKPKEPKAGGSLAGMVLAPMVIDQLLKRTGNGIYSAGVSLSPAQSRSLRSGRGITLKPSMLGDAGRYVMSVDEAVAKKLMDAFRKNKGVKMVREMMSDMIDRKSGGSLFGNVARVLAPIIAEKVIDAGVAAGKKKLGDGIFAAGAGMGEGIFSAGVRGGDMLPIQTGTPALLQSSPASDPIVPSQLLTVSQPSTGGARKKKVRM